MPRRAPIGFGDPPRAASLAPLLALCIALALGAALALAGCA